MAEEKSAEKKPEPAKAKKADKKASGGGWTARFTGLFNSAGCASCLTAVFLMLLVVGVWLFFWLEPGNIPWRHSMSWWRITLEVLLVIAIPLVLYQAIRLWLQGEQSAFPDIDFAWKTGAKALSQNGLSLQGAPLFLVVGSAGVRQESALLGAAGLALRVHDLPEGPAPLHWYAGPDGIYLVLSEACGLSSLAALLEKRRGQAGALGDAPVPAALPPATRAARLAAPAAPSTARASKPVGTSSRGTIMLDQFVADRQVEEAQAAQAATATETEEQPEPSAVVMAASDQPAILSQQESGRQLARLEYVSQLLRQARFPLCPANGVLVLLPFELLQATQRETQQLQKTARADLACLQRELALRCPVTALIVGMHQERGFRELVRRVGRERAVAQRFGRRFDARIVPSAEAITNLCALAAGTFEDWIHTLFREAEALARPGNLRLYGLLCKMRSTLSSVLSEVLVGTFAHDPQSKELPEPIPFSGCYFAATGESDDQQAFVRGVFEKLTEEQEEVEWTHAARTTNRTYQKLTAAAVALTVCCVIAIVALAVWRVVR
jgi:IcmF-related N-terminal domain